jgi:hypothetical protein
LEIPLVKAKLVVVVEHGTLVRVKVLISNSLVHLELLENKEGNLFLASSIEPEGIVYYGTTPALFCKFWEGLVTLQTLFNETPSHFVEIVTKTKTALYNRNDIEIVLVLGDKTFGDLADQDSIEVW